MQQEAGWVKLDLCVSYMKMFIIDDCSTRALFFAQKSIKEMNTGRGGKFWNISFGLIYSFKKILLTNIYWLLVLCRIYVTLGQWIELVELLGQFFDISE